MGPLIEDLTTDDAEIYIHNPPRVLKEYLEDQHKRVLIDLDVKSEDYGIKRDSKMFIENIVCISLGPFGQENAIAEISKSLWYLTTVKREKPYIIMLYGNSSLGKTQLVREVSKKFFGGKCLEKHLSMFKNNNYSEYFSEMRLIVKVLDLIYLNVNQIWSFLTNWTNAQNTFTQHSIRCLITHFSKTQRMMLTCPAL